MSMGAGPNMHDGGGASAYPRAFAARAGAYDVAHSQGYGPGLVYSQDLHQGYGSMSTDVMEAVGEPHVVQSPVMGPAQQQQQSMPGMPGLPGAPALPPVGGSAAMTPQAMQMQMQHMQMQHQMQMQQMQMQMQMQQMAVGTSGAAPRPGLAMPGGAGTVGMSMPARAQVHRLAQQQVPDPVAELAVDDESDSASHIMHTCSKDNAD